jgi:hypothetical protein
MIQLLTEEDIKKALLNIKGISEAKADKILAEGSTVVAPHLNLVSSSQNYSNGLSNSYRIQSSTAGSCAFDYRLERIR